MMHNLEHYKFSHAKIYALNQNLVGVQAGMMNIIVTGNMGVIYINQLKWEDWKSTGFCLFFILATSKVT